jgi:hypothetical protein
VRAAGGAHAAHHIAAGAQVGSALYLPIVPMVIVISGRGRRAIRRQDAKVELTAQLSG